MTRPSFREPDWSKPPELWEDGQRVPRGPDTFEWWYVDTQMNDGSTAVLLFQTRSLERPQETPTPSVLLTISKPDGTRIKAEFAGDFSAAEKRCHVEIGPNWLQGDLQRYTLHVEGEAEGKPLGADLEIVGLVPAWRPKPAAGDKIAAQLGWIPAVPHGTVSGALTYGGDSHKVSGNAYHDHDFGEVKVLESISHWFWGRAHMGPYTAIYSTVYGVGTLTGQLSKVFFLAQEQAILAQAGPPLQLQQLPDISFPGSQLKYPNGLHCDWQDSNRLVQLAVSNPRMIEEIADTPPSCYARFQAEPRLTVRLAGIDDTAKGSAIYEVMRFQPG
jgi:hypothetical protein